MSWCTLFRCTDKLSLWLHDFMANSCLILQISHVKSFKMRYISSLYLNFYWDIHENAWSFVIFSDFAFKPIKISALFYDLKLSQEFNVFIYFLHNLMNIICKYKFYIELVYFKGANTQVVSVSDHWHLCLLCFNSKTN